MYLIRTLIFTLVIFPLLQTSAVWGKSLLGGSSKNKHSLILLKKGNDSIHPKQGDIIYYQLILKNFKDTVIFDTHKEFHQMNDKEVEFVVGKILDYKSNL